MVPFFAVGGTTIAEVNGTIAYHGIDGTGLKFGGLGYQGAGRVF